MGRQYSHLTEEDRIDIHIFLKENKTLREISNLLGRSPSTISREIERNKGQNAYKPRQAQKKASIRKSKARYKKAVKKNNRFLKPPEKG